jgi:segregation and condensation protein B
MNEENHQEQLAESFPVESDAEAEAEIAVVAQIAQEEPEQEDSDELAVKEGAGRALDPDSPERDSPEIDVSDKDLPEIDLIDQLVAEGEAEEAMVFTEDIFSPEGIEASGDVNADSFAALLPETEDDITATHEELKPVIESLLFVADEPLPFKQLCKVLGSVDEGDVRTALEELVRDYDARSGGLEIREIAGGWRISTRPQNHDFIRKYLKSRPTARLSLPALETLAVIAYKQPITIPEILDIRGVSSTSAIKTLLEKRLIVTKGRKETVGRPMMYGTSKEFLIQFGLKDLSELPSIEDFEDLAQ